MAKVVVVEGPNPGAEFSFEQAAILGRLDTSDIPVPDKKASREHAKIYQQGQKFSIVDLNSSNGTFVNGAQITKQVLEDGDEIEIGLIRLRFENPKVAKAATQKRKSLDDDFGKKEKQTAADSAAASGGPPEIVMRGHQPMQYSRVKAGRTLLGFDLDQVSDTARFFIMIGAILLFAGLLFVAYKAVAG